MKIIGITGKSGSGKSTLTEMLSRKIKCISINVDKIGHKATNDEKIMKKLCDIFGKEILGDNYIIDRKKLGNIVFSSKEKMDILTDITWGYMQEKIDELFETKPDIIILEWALLPISKYWEKCGIKILIKSNYEDRKNKVLERDGITEEYFEKRDSKSLEYENLKFDYVFKNDYTEKSMKDFAEVILKEITE